jgi:hypothetical protein
MACRRVGIPKIYPNVTIHINNTYTGQTEESIEKVPTAGQHKVTPSITPKKRVP